MAIQYLDGLDGEYAFIHEAALAAWGISYNSFLKQVDVLRLDSDDGNETALLSGNIELRIWSRELSEHVGVGEVKLVWSDEYQYHVVEPELVLALLPQSPNYQELYEAQARLALVLHHDEMSDPELMEFIKYVRGI